VKEVDCAFTWVISKTAFATVMNLHEIHSTIVDVRCVSSKNVLNHEY
jgi:hypothetical protein